VALLGFSFSECPPAAGDLIGQWTLTLAVDDVLSCIWSSHSEAFSLVALGAHSAAWANQIERPRQAESACAGIAPSRRRRGRERFIVGDLAP